MVTWLRSVCVLWDVEKTQTKLPVCWECRGSISRKEPSPNSTLNLSTSTWLVQAGEEVLSPESVS